MINRRWHQAHEERHLQRCDDKQQPNDQEHQQRVGHLCNEATTHFQELHCPVWANYKQQLEGKQQLQGKQQLITGFDCRPQSTPMAAGTPGLGLCV